MTKILLPVHRQIYTELGNKMSNVHPKQTDQQ